MQDMISVLAVDDEPFNLDLIEAAFEEYDNINIVNATSGKEALAFLESVEFDIVLLDISMPVMNGLEALKEIRRTAKLEQLPILMVSANSEKEQEVLTLGANDFISKPYDIDILCARTINYAKLNFFHKQMLNQKNILEQKVQERTLELQSALDLAKKTEYEISIRLGRASEFRDLDTGSHIKRMSHYSRLLASLYGLEKDECKLILYAAPLHDIGKVGIPDNILLKPGRLESYEFEIMKQHSAIGAKMLEGADEFSILKAGHIIALEHHEKWDGSGYPNGKIGTDIHLYARIVTIADVFDALSSKRCYKEAMPLDKVLSIMKEDAGTHFDPTLVNLFLENLEEFLVIKDLYKDEKTETETETEEIMMERR